MTLVSARNLTVAYSGQEALRDVDFDISAGEIVTVIGPNGSGKTTLLRAIVGALKPTSGLLWRKAGLRVGYAPQQLKINGTLPMTVMRFLNLPVRKNMIDCRDALREAGAGGFEHKQIASLSSGQFQRILLARALLENPELLLLDEPTTGLDQSGSAAFYRRIEAVRRDLGCAVLMVSHELHVVMSASDRVICLNGRVCCHGTPAAVASAPEYRALFGTGTQGALALYRHAHDHDHRSGAHIRKNKNRGNV